MDITGAVQVLKLIHDWLSVMASNCDRAKESRLFVSSWISRGRLVDVLEPVSCGDFACPSFWVKHNLDLFVVAPSFLPPVAGVQDLSAINEMHRQTALNPVFKNTHLKSGLAPIPAGACFLKPNCLGPLKAVCPVV